VEIIRVRVPDHPLPGSLMRLTYLSVHEVWGGSMVQRCPALSSASCLSVSPAMSAELDAM